MTKPKKHMSAAELEEVPIEAIQSFLEEFDIVTTQEGANVIKSKEQQLEFIQYIDSIKEKLTKRLNKVRRIKSSKGKYPSNLTPKKKKR